MGEGEEKWWRGGGGGSGRGSSCTERAGTRLTDWRTREGLGLGLGLGGKGRGRQATVRSIYNTMENGNNELGKKGVVSFLYKYAYVYMWWLLLLSLAIVLTLNSLPLQQYKP